MNVVLVYRDGTLVTPESDSILEGITRDSVLQLAKDRGHTVESRKVTIDEWRDGAASGDIVGRVRLRHRRGDHAHRSAARRGLRDRALGLGAPRSSRCRCARSSPASSTAASRTATAG